MTQNEEVLAHLKTGHTITNAQAFTNYRITRLAARIHDLRGSGYRIASRTVKRRSKRTGRLVVYAAYYLED